MSSKVKSVKVVLKHVRLSFPAIFGPKDFEGDGNFKYQAALLIDPSTKVGEANAKAVKRAIKEVTIAQWGKKKVKLANKCLKKGEDRMPDDEAYENMLVVQASNKKQPKIINRAGNLYISPEEAEKLGYFYSGCYVNAVIHVKPYIKFGGGVSAYLQGLQFAEEGEPLGAEGVDMDDFDGYEDASEEDEMFSEEEEDDIEEDDEDDEEDDDDDE